MAWPDSATEIDMDLYLFLYKIILPGRYRDYLQRADGNLDKLRETLLHKTFYEEYDRYDFAHKSQTQRRTYITDYYRNRVCRRINNPRQQALIMDKYRAAQVLKDYYGRRFMKVASETDRAAFIRFGEDMGQLVAKPVDDCGGRGVRLLAPQASHQWADLFDEMIGQKRRFIVEERIVQDPFMAAFNPSSVNTVRINTFLHRGRVSRFTAILKTGRKGTFVDNGAQGGIMALAHSETGLIVTDAIDDLGHSFTVHPDSGQAFRGVQIPRWEELKRTTTEMALLFPRLTFIGWDMALTPDGWIAVEGNKGEFFAEQIVLRRGLKKEFDQMCKDGAKNKNSEF